MEASEDYLVFLEHLLLTAVITWMFSWKTVEQEEIYAHLPPPFMLTVLLGKKKKKKL